MNKEGNFYQIPNKLLEIKDDDAIYLYAKIVINAWDYSNHKKYLFNEITLELNDNNNYEQSLKQLADNGFIKKISCGNYCYVKESFDKDFVKFWRNEFETIENCEFKNKTTLFAHFIHMAKSINYNTSVGFSSIARFAGDERKSLPTINKMNKQLADLKLVSFLHRHRHTNAYSRYCDQEYLT